MGEAAAGGGGGGREGGTRRGGVVRAAGGVLWRPGPTPGGVEVALVHRPRYDDWTFPKGKRDGCEADLDTAVREVREETGYEVEVGPELGTTRYVHRGRDKLVRYWAMRAIGGEFVSTDEVDRLVWMPPAQAARCLTYGRDYGILRNFMKFKVTS